MKPICQAMLTASKPNYGVGLIRQIMVQQMSTISFTTIYPAEPFQMRAFSVLLKLCKLGGYTDNLAEGEASEVSQLEIEYAKWQGVDYCGPHVRRLCDSACFARLYAVPGDKILANAYTLAPVPGAIHNGGVPILVDIDENYIDMNDLAAKATTSGARFLLLSHMRGHIADMDKIMDICSDHNICLIEDCAHTMGARWRGTRSGNFGKVAAFSTQTYKHMNSGEGGFLTTDDAEIAARAVVSSGSYMLYGRNGAIPAEDVFQKVRLYAPNYSGRMDHMRAAILRAQPPLIETNIERWNSLMISSTSGLAQWME